jgi:hypothetical protein
MLAVAALVLALIVLSQHNSHPNGNHNGSDRACSERHGDGDHG